MQQEKASRARPKTLGHNVIVPLLGLASVASWACDCSWADRFEANSVPYLGLLAILGVLITGVVKLATRR